MKGKGREVEEAAKSLKGMPFKNDLSLIPSTYVKKTGQVMCTYIPNTGEVEIGGTLRLAGLLVL